MVKHTPNSNLITEDTVAVDSVTLPANFASSAQPSWARWWRQVLFVPSLHNRWLNAADRDTLTKAVTDAEKGHRGEVFFVVENSLPLDMARTHDSRDRAIQLFGEFRVWDTAENTGVLLYLNICEKRIEIIADRGINSLVMPGVWQAMCDKAIEGIKTGKQVASLVNLLTEIGQVLRQHCELLNDARGNELPDTMVYLR